MVINKQIIKPANWDDFEHLCKRLWGELWNCNDRIKRHGRQGQAQHGVDIYAYNESDGGYCGIQCKGKDEYIHAQLTTSEIEKEIEKAKTFEPPLKRLIFATTANKDTTIEAFVRQQDIKNRQHGLFTVELYQWEDIVDLFEIATRTYKWYMNNSHYIQSVDINISVESPVEGYAVLHPVFVRKMQRYKLQKATDFCSQRFPLFIMSKVPKMFPQVVNHALCEIVLIVENIGNTTIEDYKIKIEFDKSEIKSVDSLLHFSIMDSQQIKQLKIQNQSVFEYSNCEYSLLCEPNEKSSILVEKDTRSFKFAVEPLPNVNSITLNWTFLSRGFSKDGTFIIPIEATYKEEVEEIYVDSHDELLPDEILSTESYLEELD